jgi:RHS repeat-associated protein
MTISKSNWTTVLVDTCISAYSLASAVSTTGTASSSTNGGNLVLTAPEASDMLVLMQNVVAGVSNTMQLDINRLTGGNDNGVQVVIVEEINNVEYVIGSGYLHQGSKQSLNFTPTIDVAKLKIYGPFDEMVIATTCTKKAATVQHTYLVDVCDEDGDRYRFGFNGQEKDNELKGVGNSLDFGARMYDSRLGRWLSLDPLAAKYPTLSPYNFVGNSPLMFIDPDGKRIVVYHNGKAYPYHPGVEPAKGSPDILMKVHEAASYNMQTKVGNRIWTNVGNSDKILHIHAKEAELRDIIQEEDGVIQTNTFYPKMDKRKDADKVLGDLYWDHNSRVSVAGKSMGDIGNNFENGFQSPSTVLLHEMGHVERMIIALINGVSSKEWSSLVADMDEDFGADKQYGTKEERRNIELNETQYIEEINKIESEINGENASYQRPRKNHGGTIRYRENDANVNKNPSKNEQMKIFNSPD